jgi:hypothetical protein
LVAVGDMDPTAGMGVLAGNVKVLAEERLARVTVPVKA